MSRTVHEEKEIMPTVAIVGRVNVGKSTFFNKMIDENKAIVSTIAGTTRTNNIGTVWWRGEAFRLIDTGGLTFDDEVLFEDEILRQSERAMKEADLILFFIDAQEGVLPQERELAKRFRRMVAKPVVLVANKVDNQDIIQENLYDPSWYALGLGEPFPISASSGYNTGDLLDQIYEQLFADVEEEVPENEKEQYLDQKTDEDEIQISLIGKPNVGKSSLFNRLVGEERVIVSPMAHTTREPFDTVLQYQYELNEESETQAMRFIDTAGIRRKARVKGFLERMGIQKSINAIDQSDIVLFVVDATEPISSQDMQLGGLVEKRSKSVIILINKWDLVEDHSEQHQKEVKARICSYFPHLRFAEVLFVSGKLGTGVHKIFPKIMQVWRSRHTIIPESTLEKFLEYVTRKHLPSRGKGTRQPKVMGMRQINAAPPVFEIFIKYRTSIHRSYVHYLENRLREQFDFTGTPIVIKLRKMRRHT